MKINLRPFVYQFLDEMKEYYNLVLFTASQKSYARKIIQILDPKKKYFHQGNCLFRSSCVQTKTKVTKPVNSLSFIQKI